MLPNNVMEIVGVTVKNNESANLILDDIKTMVEEAGTDVPHGAVDRAHRIDQG